MFRMNRSWPGTSTTPARVPSPRRMREAQVDRDAALLLFLQAIRVRSGERADERRLAVVDVPGGPDDDRHHGTRASAKISRPSRMRSTTAFTARNGAGYVAAGPRWKSTQRGVVSP
jgi:hypothetical protein